MATYFGAKSGMGVFQTIIAAMPPHDTFIDAFAGGGTILRQKPRAAHTLAIDRDPAAILALAEDDTLADRYQLGDARSLLVDFDYAAAGRVLVYCDPPYLLSTRTGKQRYTFDFEDRDHMELLTVLKALPAAVMVSGYPSVLYDDQLADWRSIAFQAMTRGGVRTEKIWCNFPAGAVHWASFAGRNFTHRQQIKRKAARWAAKFSALPPAEKTAILAALLASDSAAQLAPPMRESPGRAGADSVPMSEKEQTFSLTDCHGLIP